LIGHGERWERRRRTAVLAGKEKTMIGKLIAGWIGSKIDRRDGEGGAVGAAVGVATWEVAKRVVPAAFVLGAGAVGAAYLKRKLTTEHGPDTGLGA
jgi:hypothetical protein